MPLTADWTKVADYADLNTDANRPLRDALTMSSVVIGIGTWTEDNAPEVYARIHLIEDLYGPFLYTTPAKAEVGGKPVDRPITPADVQRLIGLRTNVGKTETRASFIKRHVGYKLDDGVRAYRKATTASDAA